MPRPTKVVIPDIIYCACGCKEIVPKKKYPSQQNWYIKGHQHRGKNNKSYKGGKEKRVCPICNKSFFRWPSQRAVSCGSDECYKPRVTAEVAQKLADLRRDHGVRLGNIITEAVGAKWNELYGDGK